MLSRLRSALGARVAGALVHHNLTCTNLQQVRPAVTAFNSSNIDHLWKCITVVSKSGKKRGRGKRTNSRLIKDLYKDQKVGDGKVKMIWPGLNTSVMKGRQLVTQRPAEEDPNQLVAEAQELKIIKRKINALDRGFTSVNICGRNIKNTTNLVFHEEFDYRVIDQRFVSHMTGLYGRYHRFASVVVCGNGNGVIGIGAGKALSRTTALQKACNRSLARLLFIERYNNHTVLHDFFSQYYATKIFVSRKPEGYGLHCHRVIKLICQLVGIKDLHAKVEGSTFPTNIGKAFILGLVRQKKYEEFAEEKKLHLVEFNPQRRNYPNVLASPSVCRKAEEIPTSESLDFTQMSLGGRVKFERPKRLPFYIKNYTKGWQIHLKKAEKLRGAKETEYYLRVKYGGKPHELGSFLTKKYPECRRTLWALPE